jgi:hypothetical protein
VDFWQTVFTAPAQRISEHVFGETGFETSRFLKAVKSAGVYLVFFSAFWLVC